MAVHHSALRYRQTDAQSRTPLELVVMLYDGAIGAIAQARQAMERGDIRSRSACVARALAIVSELQSTLDMHAGGEIAESLDRLYGFVSGRLIEASARKNLEALDEASRVLGTLRDGWSQAAASR